MPRWPPPSYSPTPSLALDVDARGGRHPLGAALLSCFADVEAPSLRCCSRDFRYAVAAYETAPGWRGPSARAWVRAVEAFEPYVWGMDEASKIRTITTLSVYLKLTVKMRGAPAGSPLRRFVLKRIVQYNARAIDACFGKTSRLCGKLVSSLVELVAEIRSSAEAALRSVEVATSPEFVKVLLEQHALFLIWIDTTRCLDSPLRFDLAPMVRQFTSAWRTLVAPYIADVQHGLGVRGEEASAALAAALNTGEEEE